MSYVLGGPLDFLQNAATQASSVVQSAGGQIAAQVRGKNSGAQGNPWDEAAKGVTAVLERLRRQSLIGGSGAQYSGFSMLVNRFLKGDLAQLKPAMDAGSSWGSQDPQAKPLVDDVNSRLYKMAEDVVSGKMDPPSGSAGVDDLARRLPELPKMGGGQIGRPMLSGLFFWAPSCGA